MAAYSFLLGAGLFVSAPWWLLRMATTARYREGLRERLGRVPPALREAVRNRRVLWVHAVSVGEVLAVTRLITELESALLADASPQDQAARPGAGIRLARRRLHYDADRPGAGSRALRRRTGLLPSARFPLDGAGLSPRPAALPPPARRKRTLASPAVRKSPRANPRGGGECTDQRPFFQARPAPAAALAACAAEGCQISCPRAKRMRSVCALSAPSRERWRW